MEPSRPLRASCLMCRHDRHSDLTDRLDAIERTLGRLMSALTDLQGADASLQAEVAKFLLDIAGRLGTVSDPAAEAVVADINTEVAALQAADVPHAP